MQHDYPTLERGISLGNNFPDIQLLIHFTKQL